MSLKKMLDDHGFGKQPDWNKELYSWCQDWVNELKSATDQLRPSIKREGNIIIEVDKVLALTRCLLFARFRLIKMN